MIVCLCLCVVVIDFSESLSVVREAVKQADFLAVDAEFSGLLVCLFVQLLRSRS